MCVHFKVEIVISFAAFNFFLFFAHTREYTKPLRDCIDHANEEQHNQTDVEVKQ